MYKLHKEQIEKSIHNLENNGRVVQKQKALEIGQRLINKNTVYRTAMDAVECFKAVIWQAGLVT